MVPKIILYYGYTNSGVSRIYFSRGRKKIRGAEKNSGEAESRLKGANFFCPPSPAEFDSAPEAEQARGGRKRKKHLIIENRGRKPN
jgi:hypothetical protein